MSGDGPESIPTSADRRSKRPVKKRALTPVSAQAAGLDALFAKPDQTIRIPQSADVARVRGSAPPEIISNVQGSSSGAGSGEFHVYKASRRREYARLRQLDEEAARDRDAQDFEKTKRERETRDDEKTRRNREKREKAKARKAQGKHPKGGQAGDGSLPFKKTSAPISQNPSIASTKPTFSRPGNENDGNSDAEHKSDHADVGRSQIGATSTENGARRTAPEAEPLPAADGPGLLIQDDDS
ncbi:hypothetical protein SEPCBS119000_005765 [Sporothrix epigloea]|uniref:DUF1168 domain protein n=1 Tax=Sporothrix epigloea TaxID=1892477 RepID=A0ABP0E1L2_9PEZI